MKYKLIFGWLALTAIYLISECVHSIEIPRPIADVIAPIYTNSELEIKGDIMHGPSYSTNRIFLSTNGLFAQDKCYLTVKRPSWTTISGTYIIRVTDAEWQLITNHYAVPTNGPDELRFYGK